MSIGNPISLTSQVASKTISIIATASQTAFTVTGGYRINQLAVFRNGIRLVDSRDYEARDGATVTLLSAASEGDAVEFQVFDAFQVADTINPYSTYQTIDGNLNITGIITAATFSITDLDVRNITGVAATFTGQVTYEDVTNVDSIGIITARSYVSIADSIVHTGDIDTAIRFPAADTFTVETAGSERLRVSSGGNVGVGTDNPQGKLHVSDGANGLEFNPNSENAIVSYDRINTVYRPNGLQGSTVSLGIGGVGTALRIDSSGNVGINSSIPASRLDVVGDVNIIGIATATQLFEGTTRVATSGKAIAMALIFG
jgi:hypothetical protein